MFITPRRTSRQHSLRFSYIYTIYTSQQGSHILAKATDVSAYDQNLLISPSLQQLPSAFCRKRLHILVIRAVRGSASISVHSNEACLNW